MELEAYSGHKLYIMGEADVNVQGAGERAGERAGEWATEMFVISCC